MSAWLQIERTGSTSSYRSEALAFWPGSFTLVKMLEVTQMYNLQLLHTRPPQTRRSCP